MFQYRLAAVAFLSFSSMAVAEEKQPRSVDPRIKIELFAEQPQIVTPTGIDIDSQGRVWAIESNTHFPPADYAGHKSDRLLVMRDKDGDGRAEQIDMFADGFTHSMSVAVRRSSATDKPDQVYLATRRDIFILTDDDGDLRADTKKRIIHLETKGDYPHNGLAGFAWDAEGWMYFGFGENLGATYQIIGSDGHSFSGGGEGGNLYRCKPDGSQLTQWATGFWNPHASCIDGYGRMFTVDNDPDSRPPCRLLHIIRDGDYGYRFRNGRKGLHPFTSWNGEIPGTLPMVAGTGEAPSGIVAYESGGLPEEYLGNLLVTSWGDHRIDRFRLKPKGASYESLAEPLIVGGENFRPVGLAVAPDGSLYCTDWVLKDYKIHGKGRVWRISGMAASSRKPDLVPQVQLTPEAKSIQALLDDSVPVTPAMSALRSSADPFLFSAALRRSSQLVKEDKNSSDIGRSMLHHVLSARRQSRPASYMAAVGLTFPDSEVRRVAVQWVAEERLMELRPHVEALLTQEPMTRDLFLAVLAALEMLDGVDAANFDKTPAGKYVLPILLDAKRPPAVRAQALRLVSPAEPALKLELFKQLLQSEDAMMRLEAIRTLTGSPLSEAGELLVQLALSDVQPLSMRAEAVAGLASVLSKAQPNDSTFKGVQQLLASSQPALAIESLRSLRGRDRNDAVLRPLLLATANRLPASESLDDTKREIAEELSRLLPDDQWTMPIKQVRDARPANVESWLQVASQPGDRDAGRRVFFHRLGAGCWKCHTVEGRGGAIGPDLSMIARTMSREKLAQSILEPGKEIAPQFTTWTFVMASGQVHQGMILGDTRDGKQRIGLSDGRELDLRVEEIEQREPSPLSLMPTNLIDQLTVSEFRHLLAFLESLK